MRLLHKDTLEMNWFIDGNIPPYLILSHRWEGAETSLQQFEAEKRLDKEKQSVGTAKVLRFCKEAKAHEAEYVWVDTCCIDKTSSAELQEAINSMYRWYEEAELCTVYLSDVSADKPLDAELAGSEWFTRGWTLQEMLAPRAQTFVDRAWAPLGSRAELGERLARITGVPHAYYGDAAKIRGALVAERMSWVSARRTSRVEDLSYCMLGLFDVSLTMLYGEGAKAFGRLQREILQLSDDESIFAWLPTAEPSADGLPILAPHPACFAVCRGLKLERSVYYEREPYRMTSHGLEIELYNSRDSLLQNELMLYLNCTADDKRVAIRLLRKEKRNRDLNRWRRDPVMQMTTFEKGAQSAPPTVSEEYFQRQHEITLQRHTAFQNNNPSMAQMRHSNERIRHKVYIE